MLISLALFVQVQSLPQMVRPRLSTVHELNGAAAGSSYPQVQRSGVSEERGPKSCGSLREAPTRPYVLDPRRI